MDPHTLDVTQTAAAQGLRLEPVAMRNIDSAKEFGDHFVAVYVHNEGSKWLSVYDWKHDAVWTDGPYPRDVIGGAIHAIGEYLFTGVERHAGAHAWWLHVPSQTIGQLERVPAWPGTWADDADGTAYLFPYEGSLGRELAMYDFVTDQEQTITSEADLSVHSLERVKIVAAAMDGPDVYVLTHDAQDVERLMHIAPGQVPVTMYTGTGADHDDLVASHGIVMLLPARSSDAPRTVLDLADGTVAQWPEGVESRRVQLAAGQIYVTEWPDRIERRTMPGLDVERVFPMPPESISAEVWGWDGKAVFLATGVPGQDYGSTADPAAVTYVYIED